MENSLLAPLATLTAALIGGTTALVSTVLSKESKLSDFRQSWIDSLRLEISELISNLLLVRKFEDVSEDATSDDRKDARRALLDADRALVLIRLRLNEKEMPSSELLSTLEEIENFSNQSDHPIERMTELEKKLINQSKLVLTSEWHRVRDGEKFYRFIRNGSVLAIIISIIALISMPILLPNASNEIAKPDHLARPTASEAPAKKDK